MKTSKNKKLKRIKSIKKLRCSPKNKKSYSCYTDKSLHKLKKYWNIRHPDEAILTNNTKEIWNKLKSNLDKVCETEACWLRQKFMENNLDTELRNYTFAPKTPEKWKKNKNTWLTSTDLENVMKQYEDAYKNFLFIGPSPLDFDVKKMYNTCVWDELCKFNLKSHIANNKTKIGIIFNMDPHYKDGSHWMAMMIDVNKSIIYYFDSNGDKIPSEIKKLVDRIIQQGQSLNIDFKFYQNHPFEHQEGNTECGIYTLYFISEILKNNKDYNFFSTQKITDQEMEQYRTIFFNSEI